MTVTFAPLRVTQRARPCQLEVSVVPVLSDHAGLAGSALVSQGDFKGFCLVLGDTCDLLVRIPVSTLPFWGGA